MSRNKFTSEQIAKMVIGMTDDEIIERIRRMITAKAGSRLVALFVMTLLERCNQGKYDADYKEPTP